MNGKFVLRKDKKPNEWGEYSVVLQYTTQRVPIRCATNIFVHPSHWLGDNGRSDKYIKTGKDGHPKAEYLNRTLLKFKKEKDELIEQIMLGKPNVKMSVPTLRSILNGTYQEKLEEQNGKVEFIGFVLNLHKEIYEMEKISYSLLDNIKSYMNLFGKFLQSKHINPQEFYCRDLNVDLIKDYILWRKARGNTNDTINKSLTPIFKAIKKCSHNGWVDRYVADEICEMYLPSQAKALGNANDTTLHYLDEAQINKLIEVVSQSKYPRTKELWDLFMFSIYAFGMRLSDVCTLRWEEIDMEKRMIHHLQVKNHTRKAKWLDINLCDGAIKILEKWRGKYDNFVFGQLDEEFDLNDEVELKHIVNSRDRTINISLREIGKKAGLPFHLHFHVSRHTFACLALNKDVGIGKLAHMMAHSSSQTTERVYAKYFPQTIKQESDERLNFDF